MYKRQVFDCGQVIDYSCSNFETEEENRKYIEDNILFHHPKLAMEMCIRDRYKLIVSFCSKVCYNQKIRKIDAKEIYHEPEESRCL